MSDYDPRHDADETDQVLSDVTTPLEEQSPPALVFSGATYEWLRACVEVIFPGFATFYLALSQIWDLPGGEKVSATVTAFTVFLGLVVRLARRSYNRSEAKFDGVVQLTDDPANQQVSAGFALAPGQDPKALLAKKELTLKVLP